MEQLSFTTRDKVDLTYYINRVKGNKPFIVFIHGAGSNHSIFKPLLKAFSKQNTLTLDLRHHGRSGFGKLDAVTITRLADDLRELCLHEKIPSVVLVGNCLGASVAHAFYKKHRKHVRRMVLLTLFSGRYVRHSSLLNIVGKTGYTILKPFTQKRNLKFQDYHKYEKRPIWYYPYLDVRGTPVTTCLKLATELFAYEPYIANLRVPTLVIVAEHDWSTKNTLIRSDARSNEYVTVAGVASNHVPLTRVYKDVVRKIQSFIGNDL